MWVRTASKRDIAIISELLGLVWHKTYDDIYGADKVEEITRDWHSTSALERNLGTPASEFLVADDGVSIAGMAFARQINDNQVSLSQLYVLPESQGRGVGQMLLDEIEESFFEAREFTLEVEEKNSGAIRFYEKNGYVKSGETKNCGKENSGIDALIYTKMRG